MSIKIHHGPPGSYKTSGAVQDDFIPAAKAGRVVITNVRGLSSRDRVIEALGVDNVPDTFELIYLQTTETSDSMENRQKLSRFWHWAPLGAFFLIDECNTIWPCHWRDKDLDALNYDASYLNGGQDQRPFSILTAFEMHRHFGWDLVLTSPHIDKIHKVIRQCSEGAYKHKNQALVGLKGRYLEAFHLAEDSGKSSSDFMSLRNRKITPVTWKLYESTATGTFSDTIAGTPFWKDPKIFFFLVFITLLFVIIYLRGAPALFSNKAAYTSPHGTASPAASSRALPEKAPAPIKENIPVSPGSGSIQTVSVSSSPLPPRDGSPRNSEFPVGPLAYANWQFLGSIAKTTDPYKATFLFRITTPNGASLIHSGALLPFGYRFSPVSSTAVRVQYENTLFLVMANPIDQQQSGAMGQTPLNPFGPAGQGTNPLRNAPGSPGAAPLPSLYRPPEFTHAQHNPNNNGHPVQLAMTPAAINQGQRVQAHTPSATHWAIKPTNGESD